MMVRSTPEVLKQSYFDDWVVISNMRYAAHGGDSRIGKIVKSLGNDTVAINFEPELSPYHEEIRLTDKDEVAGFRRYYCGKAMPAAVPVRWPHKLFVRRDVFSKVTAGEALPKDFGDFVDSFNRSGLRLRSLNVSDSVLGANSDNFRIWKRFSYPRFLKRIADVVLSSIILALFLPLFPIIAIAVKLNSAGAVFYKDKREGLWGKEFHCLKFRTMFDGSDKVQDKLRSINQVDGPQFKIEDDPRVTVVGRFLRNTYLDEIPQFINILLGQMSVVGPRPSPRKENSQCPFWRDGRLSVRPGLTGMWQIFRTRSEGCDFQEWIYYDLKYVRSLSLKLDLVISFKTAVKLIRNFVSQF